MQHRWRRVNPPGAPPEQPVARASTASSRSCEPPGSSSESSPPRPSRSPSRPLAATGPETFLHVIAGRGPDEGAIKTVTLRRVITDLDHRDVVMIGELEHDVTPPATMGSTPSASSTTTGPPEAEGSSDAMTRRLRAFEVVHVFDVSQTDGEALPDVEPVLSSGTDPDGLWEHLSRLIHADGYRIERGPCRLGANGWVCCRLG